MLILSIAVIYCLFNFDNIFNSIKLYTIEDDREHLKLTIYKRYLEAKGVADIEKIKETLEANGEYVKEVTYGKEDTLIITQRDNMFKYGDGAIEYISKHSYKCTATVPSTCTTSGYRKYICDDCGYSFIVTIPLLEHSWTSPGCPCTTTGSWKCKRCNYSITNRSPLGHTYYSSGGKYICIRCGSER